MGLLQQMSSQYSTIILILHVFIISYSLTKIGTICLFQHLYPHSETKLINAYPVLRPRCWLLNTLGYHAVSVQKRKCNMVTQREENEKLGLYKWGSDQGWHFILAGKCSFVGVAVGNTGPLIGADGKDSHLITASQLFYILTPLATWKVGECVVCSRRLENMFSYEFKSISKY